MEMKKTAAKKTAAKKIASDINSILSAAKPEKKPKLNHICDLVDCYIDEEITKNELVDKLVKLVGKPIITISEMEYTVYEDTAISTDKGIFLASRERKAGSDWVDVTDLTELRVWEYNLLVEKLNIHYPEYPIEHLEGRFV